MWESRLELAGFTPERLRSVARASAAGITIKTLADLPDDETTQRLLYRTITELLGDAPFSEPLNIRLLEVWRERFWRSSARRPEGFLLAFSRFRIRRAQRTARGAAPRLARYGPDRGETRLQGRGVVFALKLCVAQYAKEVSVEVISTRNHTGNRAMLAINEALGFIKEPAWVRLKKTL